MDKIRAADATRDLTMLLIYLTRFSKKDRFDSEAFTCAWKGYDFDVLNDLNDKDMIWQGDHPSHSKYVYLTDAGVQYAKELMDKYGIEER